jgi:hypothetical protein
VTTPGPGERDRTRAATDRILNGAPERSNGALTIVALAIEAGVRHNALTQRHTDLTSEFYQRIKERGTDNEDEARHRATIWRDSHHSYVMAGCGWRQPFWYAGPGGTY